MRFFNLDLHVSVIEDMKTQFQVLGHEIDSHLMSGHYWALDRPRAIHGTGEGEQGKIGYGSINLQSCAGPSTAANLFADMPELEHINKWQQDHYWDIGVKYDGYIATYPPSFALLYKGWPGHTVLNIPVRYDLHFTENPEGWRAFNVWLRLASDAGKLTVVANNRYDAFYYEHFVGRHCKVIPSTCDYIDRMTKPWSPREGATKLLAFGDYKGCRELAAKVPDVLFVRDVLPGNYRHDEIVKALGIIWIPYTGSIMSFFEHYWLCMPMFVPSQRFLLQLWQDGLALSEQSWHKPFTPTDLKGSRIEPAIRSGWSISANVDPNTPDGVKAWMGLYDFYDELQFPYIGYFDSWNDLKYQIKKTDFAAISNLMKKQNEIRRRNNLDAWQSILSTIRR